MGIKFGCNEDKIGMEYECNLEEMMRRETEKDLISLSHYFKELI